MTSGRPRGRGSARFGVAAAYLTLLAGLPGIPFLVANSGPGSARLKLPQGDWKAVFVSQEAAEIRDQWLELAEDSAAVLGPRVLR